MSNFFFKPKTNKHLCCPPPIEKADINSPLLIYKFPCKIKLAMKINSSVGSSNHNQCYTVANQTLNAYGKWAGCPGGSGPGYSSTMRFVPYDNGSGLGPSIGGAICNCAYRASEPLYLPVNIEAPIISGNTNYGSTLTLTGEGVWIGNPPPTLSFQWFRGSTPIVNQTNITYLTQVDDVDEEITCRVRGTNSVGPVNATSNVITPVNPVTVLLVNTNNFVQNILFSTYYLAQGSNPYVMPYGSIMTSFVVRVDGTNINMTFQSDSNPNLFTWNDNQARVGTVDTVVILDTGINISGCNKFIFNNLVYASAAQPVNLIANLGIIIYGYMIS